MLRTRLAPSPTGAQHIGNARTFLLTWIAARRAGGHICFRIEDIDSPRVKPWAVEQLATDLAWLGLDWDEGPIRQTARLDAYEAALQVLRDRELVYPCTCTRSDIAEAAGAPHFDHEAPPYPGTCAGRRAADADKLDRPFAWRFRVTASPSFLDELHGPQRIDLTQVGGDFVVWKSARTPAYQLAVVVDDAAQRINLVVRGADLLPSTPRQLLLYRAFGWEPPRFAHVPLVVGTDGRRLAKRHGDTRLAALAAAGVRSEALIGLLAWSFGWITTPKPISPIELLAIADPWAIPREPFVLQNEHLRGIGYPPNA